MDKSKYQELCDIFEIMKKEKRTCLDNQIILETTSKCLTDEQLPQELKDKVKNLLVAAETEACMSLNTKYSEETLLGLSVLYNDDLSFNEQEKVRNAIHSRLRLQEDAISHNTISQSETYDNCNLFHLSIQDKGLLDARRKLQELQEAYMKNLKNAYDLMQTLLDLRFKDVKDLFQNKIDEYTIKSRMYCLRSEILREKTRVEIFHETSISYVAYEKLLSDIYKQQSECQKQINDLLELKEKYMDVMCNQYNEILKLYLQYKSSLEYKKDLYRQLNNK